MWRSIGRITPSLEWQLFDPPTLSELFRVSYGGIGPQLASYAYLRRYFYNDEVSKAIRLYPKRQREVIEFSIPKQLLDDGLAIAYLGVKLQPKYFRGFPLPDSVWFLTIEEWI